MAKRRRVVLGLALILGVLGAGLAGVSTAGYQDLPGWHWVAGGTLRGVSFVGGVAGWAVGDGGLITYSTDAGLGWYPQTSGVMDNLRDLQFLDSTHGWAVGSGGVIVATDDGGVTWNVQSTPTSEDLHALYFVDTSTGWAVGDGGTILITQNGGLQWLPQTSPVAVTLYGVDFVDATHGWAVGADGTVIATVDGGTTWGEQPSCDEIHDLYAVDFVNADEGWIVGWGGALWQTSDGGVHWGEWLMGWTRDLYAVELTDAGHGWVVGAAGFVARLDFPSWTEQVSGVDVNLYGLKFADAQRGWAVGGAGTVLSTADGGATWVRRIGSTTMTINALYFIDPNRGWAAAGSYVGGFPGELLYTSDGGASWIVQQSGIPYMNDVQFITSGRGWAVGGRSGDGAILATIDGGAHWVAQTSPITGPMRGVHFVSPDDGWAVGGAIGGNGWILNTTDAGSEWAVQKTIYGSGCLYDVCFSDFTHGWAVGAEGAIWATVNGTDWFTQTSGSSDTLSSIYCDGRLAWIVGESDILATRDGGDTWSVQDSGYADAIFFDVDFSGPGWGWVTGFDNSGLQNLLLATGDQGTTWLPEELPFDPGLLNSVHAFRWGRGPVIWTGGANGAVLSNRPDPATPVAGTVTPAEGGAIFSIDGSTSLVFPAGAVTATVTVTYTPMLASQVPSTGDLASFRIFDLAAVYSGTTTPAGLAPGANYTVTVDYAGAALVEDEWLGLYSWSGGAWVREATSSADWDSNLVMANPDHFSYFAVLGKSYSVYLPIVLRDYP